MVSECCHIGQVLTNCKVFYSILWWHLWKINPLGLMHILLYDSSLASSRKVSILDILRHFCNHVFPVTRKRLMSFNWFSYLCYLRCSNFMIRYLILYAFINLWPSCFAQLFFNIQPKYSVSCFFFKNSTSSFSSAYFGFSSMSVPGNDMLLWLLLELLESNDNFDFNFKE